MLLKKANHKDFTYRLGNRYDSTYSRLAQILTADELALFAQTEYNDYERIWFTEAPGAVSKLADLPDDGLRDSVREAYYALHESILKKIKADKELASLSDKILTVPTNDNIHVVKSDKGYSVVLSQWGCNLNTKQVQYNPLEKLIAEVEDNSAEVTLNVRFSDGTLAKQSNVTFIYKSVEKSLSTDENGQIRLGKLKHNSVFEIGDAKARPSTFSSFTVGQEAMTLEVVIPLLTDVNIQVVNQLGAPVPNYKVQCGEAGSLQTQITNAEGQIQIFDQKLSGKSFVISSIDDASLTQNYQLSTNGNALEFVIHQIQQYALTVRVIDNEGNIVPDYPIQISTASGVTEAKSQSNGLTFFEQINENSQVTVQDGLNAFNNTTYQISSGDNELDFEVTAPTIHPYTLQFLDADNKPLNQFEVTIKNGDEIYNRRTDDNGVVTFENSAFKANDELLISSSPNNEPRFKSKKLSIETELYDYTLKIKKFNKLWLLLLLIPLLLLLLIERPKQIQYVTVDANTLAPIANVDVDFSFVKHAIYKRGKFFTRDTFELHGLSDTGGIVTFDTLSYTFYEAIFKRWHPTQLRAYNDCYHNNQDEVLTFHALSGTRKNVVKMYPNKSASYLRVVDAENGDLIPNAKVILDYGSSNEYRDLDSVISNSVGQAIFPETYKCGRLQYAYASKYGYFSDTLEQVSMKDLRLASDKKGRTIKMKPIKESISFFVKNCDNDEPLIASADILLDGVKINPEPISTDVRGKGRGFYDDLHVSKKLTIRVSHKYFEDALYDPDLTVGAFIALPDSLRVICLTPQKIGLNFRTIDSLSRTPIVNSKNIISISNKLGEKVDTLYSNVNGTFTVADLSVGDVLSIHSRHDPTHRPNIIRVKDMAVDKVYPYRNRTLDIALLPRDTTLQFFVKDISANDTLVNDASLKLFINKILVSSPNNSGSGSFLVSANVSNSISITASKPGYQTNDFTIRDALFGDFLNSGEHERTIPLSLPPCNTSGDSGGEGLHLQEYNMKVNEGEFIFEYTTNAEADEIIIYNAPKGNISKQNEIFRTEEITGSSWKDVRLKFDQSSIITVQINGYSSIWQYRVNCPN